MASDTLDCFAVAAEFGIAASFPWNCMGEFYNRVAYQLRISINGEGAKVSKQKVNPHINFLNETFSSAWQLVQLEQKFDSLKFS